MGKIKAEHDNKLMQILEILENKGLTAEYSKYKFARSEVMYLGYSIRAEGIKLKKELLEGILNATEPKNRYELCSFLGLIELYSKFIERFSAKTLVLKQLLKNKSKYIWSDECDKTFCMLKKDICTAPPLQGFDPLLKSVVTIDASG
ncbi:uncharacterized protein LOC144769433 [Lissotriton helveticus]